MSRFQTRIGANDTSNFINVAALNQQGRNATADRQLATRQLQADIVESTNQQRLASNQQSIELLALQQQNEQALRALTQQFEGLRANILQSRQSDLTTRRGQDFDREATLGQQALAREGLDLQRDQLEASREESALDRAARADLQGEALASSEREGAAGRQTQERVANIQQEGATERQQSSIAADAENLNQKLKTELEIARQGNEAAMRRLDTQLANELARDANKFLNDKELLDIQHEFDMEKLSRQIEAEPIDPAIQESLIAASKEIDAISPAALSILADAAGSQGPQVQAIAERLIDMKLLRTLEKEYNDSNLVFLENMSKGEAKMILEEIVPFASPQAQTSVNQILGEASNPANALATNNRSRDLIQLLRQTLDGR